jgi:hypothetical protein
LTNYKDIITYAGNTQLNYHLFDFAIVLAPFNEKQQPNPMIGKTNKASRQRWKKDIKI